MVKPLIARQVFIRGLDKKDLIIAIDWLMDCSEPQQTLPPALSRSNTTLLANEIVKYSKEKADIISSQVEETKLLINSKSLTMPIQHLHFLSLLITIISKYTIKGKSFL